MEILQAVVHINILQLYKELYNFVDEWEPEGLNISKKGDIEASRNNIEANERIFRKS